MASRMYSWWECKLVPPYYPVIFVLAVPWRISAQVDKHIWMQYIYTSMIYNTKKLLFPKKSINTGMDRSIWDIRFIDVAIKWTQDAIFRISKAWCWKEKQVIEHIYYDSIHIKLVNSKNKTISYMGLHVYGHTICNKKWKRKWLSCGNYVYHQQNHYEQKQCNIIQIVIFVTWDKISSVLITHEFKRCWNEGGML